MPNHPTLIFHKDAMETLSAFLQACHTRGLDPGLEVATFMTAMLEAWQTVDTYIEPQLSAGYARCIQHLIQEHFATGNTTIHKETDHA